MSYREAMASAKEKMLKAEKAVETYLQGRVCDLELAKQLITDAQAARNEYLHQLSIVGPPLHRCFLICPTTSEE